MSEHSMNVKIREPKWWFILTVISALLGMASTIYNIYITYFETSFKNEIRLYSKNILDYNFDVPIKYRVNSICNDEIEKKYYINNYKNGEFQYALYDIEKDMSITDFFYLIEKNKETLDKTYYRYIYAINIGDMDVVPLTMQIASQINGYKRNSNGGKEYIQNASRVITNRPSFTTSDLTMIFEKNKINKIMIQFNPYNFWKDLEDGINGILSSNNIQNFDLELNIYIRILTSKGVTNIIRKISTIPIDINAMQRIFNKKDTEFNFIISEKEIF